MIPILLVHLTTTIYMAGVIWFVQIVHYPLLASVGESEVAAYERRHRARAFWVVAPPMLLEGMTAGLLCWQQPSGLDMPLAWLGAALLAVIWLSTACIQLPCHRRLCQGFDAVVLRRLVRTNWLRTGCWTLRAGLVILMVGDLLSWGSFGDQFMKTLKVGDQAPEFTAITHDGQKISLADYRGKSAVVLFFYPKDGTSICTKEACAFRDSYEQFVDAGAIVIGVSGDSDTSHDHFARQYNLSYPLVSDNDGSLRRLFAVPKSFGILPGRVTYVIDRNGIVQLVFNSQFDSDGHVEQALRVLSRDVRQDFRSQ